MNDDASRPEASLGGASESSTLRILVVDDEATLAHVLRSVLEDHDCEVVAAGSAEEAIERLGGPEFAVALLDIVLPGMSGLRLLERIKSSSPDTEVLMMTSHGSLETALEAIRLGAYDYLLKPFEDVETVWMAVKRAAEKRSLSLRNAALLAEQESRNRQLARAVARLSTLIDAGRTMGNLRSVEKVLDFFIGVVAYELDVERASVMLIDEERRELFIAASRGLEDLDATSVRVLLGEGISGRVASTGTPVLVTDVQSDPRLDAPKKPMLSDSFISAPIVLSFPIKAWEHVLGVLNVTNRRSGRPFDEDDLAYLSGMTGQVAVAVERTRHFEELSRAYESLQEAQAQLVLSERVKAIGQIAAGVAHDFNNLLGALLGRAQLAQWRLEATPPDLERIAEDLKAMTKFALQGAETIRRIQGFTRDRQGARRAPVRLETVVRDALDMTRPKWQSECGAAGRDLQVELALGETPRVQGNAHDLVQVVNNLVFNALDAMPSGGTLRVATRVEGDRAALVVSDTGVGMDEETRSRLFEPFFTTKESGNGLGLSIVRDIVRAHGGDIDVESAPGLGTTFRLALPVPVTNTAAIRPAKGERAHHESGARILLVDDLDDVRASFREMLASGGHHVHEARSGREALAALREAAFDVMMTDLSMPSMSGIELSREARRIAPDMPIVLVTGWPEDRPAEEFRAAGIDRVVAKPCLRQDLLAIVDEALARRSAVR